MAADELYVNTPFAVTFDLDGGEGEPDLAPLEEDFAVVGSARSSHLALEDGRVQRRQQLTLTLTPLREGEVQLPALRFGAQSSRAVTLTVRAQDAMPSDGSQILLEVTVEPEEVFVQQQVLVKVQVIRSREVDIDSARLSDPSVSGGDAIIEPLGKDRAFSTQRDGRPVEVIERRFAVIPQSSGGLTLEPLLLDARRVTGALSLSNPFGVQIQPVQLRSVARSIQVKPAPQVTAGQRWLPAAGLVLTEAWSGLDEAGRVRLGEPIVRTVGILAEGLTATQLPALDPSVPEGVNQYVEPANVATQANHEGLSAQRTEKLVLIPTREGPLALPAISLSWWNLATQRFETARLPAREVEILPAVGVQGGLKAPLEDASPMDSGASEGAPHAAHPPDRFSLDSPSGGSRDAAPAHDAAADRWPGDRLGWLALGVLVGVSLAGGIVRLLGRRSAGQAAADDIRQPSGGPATVAGARRALMRVMQAAGRNDAAATQKALLELAPHLPDLRRGKVCVRSLAEIASDLPVGALRSAVLDLQRHRYGLPAAGVEPWRGRALRDALQVIPIGKDPEGRRTGRAYTLPPLQPESPLR